jgi:rare lipoprotein A
VFHTISSILIGSLCIFGSTKSSSAFDISNSTLDGLRETQNKVYDFVRDERVERPLSTPPQPRNKSGNLVCTGNRYVQHERQRGTASWYGGAFHGKRTKSGEVFNQNALTLAHLTLPMGTEVLVENPETGVTLRAKVNDCGPFIPGRIADLSKGLAEKLGLLKQGKGSIVITVL